MRKSAHYRRAVWFNDGNFDLQSALNVALDEWNGTDVFRIFDDTDCMIARRFDVNRRLFISLIAFERGAGAAVIPAVRADADIDTDEANAPDGMEYVQAQLLCLVSGDDLLWTTHNSSIRETTVRHYLLKLLEAFHPDEEAANFALRAELDVEQLNRAFDDGIEEIDLNLGGFRATMEEALGFGPREQHGLLSHLKSLVSDHPTPEDLDAASDIGLRVAFKPGKRWRRENVKELMSEMGQNLYQQRAEYEDGFAIVTKSGLRLTHEKLTVHRPFAVEGNKRTVNPFQVRDRLDEIMTMLLEGGVLDEGGDVLE